MANLTKAMKRYYITISAFAIIQRMQPIRVTELCAAIYRETGSGVTPYRLGQYLRPFIRDEQILKRVKTDGTYYLLGNQRLLIPESPSKPSN
jgi:hypothetical protein